MILTGNRMNIRVVEVTAGVMKGWFRVQRQVSKAKNTWINYTGRDFKKGSRLDFTDGYFEEFGDAKKFAKRMFTSNNG